jgi:hypothetical protein
MLQKHLGEKNEGCRFSTSGFATGCSTRWILCQKGKKGSLETTANKNPFNDKVMLLCFFLIL